jgi:hypothetical protein
VSTFISTKRLVLNPKIGRLCQLRHQCAPVITESAPYPPYFIFYKHSHSHLMGNMIKTIDFIGDFELHGSKKRLIPSHGTKKRQRRPIFEVFLEFL